MVEVIWVAIFGAVLAWLQANSVADGPVETSAEVKPPVDDEWHRWEREIYDWRDQ